MIKLLFLGVWSCAVTVGASYGAMQWMTHSAASSPDEIHKASAKLELVKIRMISVPQLADGEVKGYVVAKLSYTADAHKLKGAIIKPDGFVIDEAFKAMYGNPAVTTGRMRGSDLDELCKSIAVKVNERVGPETIEHVLIEDLSFITKRELNAMRGNETR